MDAQPAPNEFERLEALREYRILDTPPALEFDDLTYLAAQICGTPMAMITLIDRDRQWFKSHYGTDISETPLSLSLCVHTIQEADSLVVSDATKDERFANNEVVTGERHLRFYAGVPLVTPGNHAIGALCVIDVVPREIQPEQLETLRRLARQAMAQLELQRAAAEVTHESQRFWQATLDALPSHVAVLDEQGTILATNKTWRHFAQENSTNNFHDEVGTNYLEVCANAPQTTAPEAAQVGQGIRDVLAGKLPEFRLEYPCHSPTEQLWFQIHVTRFKTQDKVRIVVAHENITDRKRVEEALQKSNDGLEILASFDALTGIRNRRSFDDRLQEEILNAHRVPQIFSVAIFDIDHFKIYNDTFGHITGDEVLRQMGQLLGRSLRPSDFVARYGGEEFALLLPNTGVAGSIEAAERTCTAIAQHNWELAPITASFGIATWNGEDAKSLLSKADTALYAAKAAGRNRVCHFSQISIFLS
jgi:diguanylate cyclase (GGDEF)-like protein